MIEIQRWNVPPDNIVTPKFGQLHLWLIELEIDRSPPSSCLSSDELSRAAQFTSKNRAQSFVVTRSAVRLILGSYLRTPAREIVFSYGLLGKPEISSPQTDLHFNLSHAGNLALLSVAMAAPVGIDIEPLRDRPGILGIAKRIFAEDTFDFLSSLPKEQLAQEFLMRWTVLEARAKAEGQGVFGKTNANTPCVNFRPAEGWIAAVALQSGVPPQKAWRPFRFSYKHFID